MSIQLGMIFQDIIHIFLDDLLSQCNLSGHILLIDELLQFLSFDVMQSFIKEGETWQGQEVMREGRWQSDFRYICLYPHDYFERRLWLQDTPLGTLSRSVGRYGRPTYVHSRVLANALETSAEVNASRYFDMIDANWGAHLGRYQNYRTKIKLPLCLTIVLNRAKSRDDIFRVIKEMRDEFSEARRTLWLHVDDALLRCTSEADCIRMLNKLENSSNSVVQEGLRKGEFYFPTFGWLGRLIKWINSGADSADVVQFAESALSGGGTSLHSIDASERLAEAIGDLQPYHHLISRHLSPSELERLAKSTP